MLVLDKVMYENRIIKVRVCVCVYIYIYSVYVFCKRKWLLLEFKEGKPKFTRFMMLTFSRMILTKVYQSTLICLEKWKMKKLASHILQQFAGKYRKGWHGRACRRRILTTGTERKSSWLLAIQEQDACKPSSFGKPIHLSFWSPPDVGDPFEK